VLRARRNALRAEKKQLSRWIDCLTFGFTTGAVVELADEEGYLAEVYVDAVEQALADDGGVAGLERAALHEGGEEEYAEEQRPGGSRDQSEEDKGVEEQDEGDGVEVVPARGAWVGLDEEIAEVDLLVPILPDLANIHFQKTLFKDLYHGRGGEMRPPLVSCQA
jgi:hypothetical protein